MKQLSNILIIVLAVTFGSCSDSNSPGSTYMPDMGESRAYETYAATANLDSHGIRYTRMPVEGTVKRGDTYPFPIAKDKAGDSANYNLSKSVQNPLKTMSPADMTEAERLYLVNCGICHGSKLDGNGPLYNGGNGPYAAAPRNLVSDPVVTGMPDGQMFYSITYGKGQMGPYGPQLSTKQRWMIINYINSKQEGGGGGGAGAQDSTAAPAQDTAAATPAAGTTTSTD